MPFQRMREARPREAHEVTMMLPHAQKVCVLSSRANENFHQALYFLRQGTTHDSVTAYPREELLRDWEHFVQPKPRPAAEHENDSLTAARLDGRAAELEDEVARLKTQLARAKGINDVMWETLMESVAAQGKEMPTSGQIPDSHEDTDGRGRKRGRTKA
jgi:pre-rRNA-processing protein IPI3